MTKNMPRDAQGENPDDERERGADAERRREGRVKRHDLDQHRHRVHADAEERRGGERDETRRAGKQRPGHGQHEIAHHADHERQPVVGQQPRQGRERADQRGERHDCDRGADGKGFRVVGHFRASRTGRAAWPRARSGTARRRPRASVRNRRNRNTAPRRRRAATPATRLPSMLPTPPMTTTTSAFMVNSMPMAGLKERKVLTSAPGGRGERAAGWRRQAPKAPRTSMPTSSRADRVDGQGPQRGAESGAVEDEPDREAEDAGHREGQHAVGREGEAQDVAAARRDSRSSGCRR